MSRQLGTCDGPGCLQATSEMQNAPMFCFPPASLQLSCPSLPPQGGDAAVLGRCRHTCKTCEACKTGDLACFNRNRKAAGYLELDRAEMEALGVADLLSPPSQEPSPEL